MRTPHALNVLSTGHQTSKCPYTVKTALPKMPAQVTQKETQPSLRAAESTKEVEGKDNQLVEATSISGDTDSAPIISAFVMTVQPNCRQCRPVSGSLARNRFGTRDSRFYF